MSLRAEDRSSRSKYRLLGKRTGMETRCQHWLPKKNRFCANTRLGDSLFCGNHNQRLHEKWIQCPIDPSHCVLEENLNGHLRRCPLLIQARCLTLQPFYHKGINGGGGGGSGEEEETVSSPDVPKPSSDDVEIVTSEMKRNAVYGMSVPAFLELVCKIKSIHASLCEKEDVRDSYKIPDACNVWINNRNKDGKMPFKEKHVLQQASILGNLEDFGVLRTPVECLGGKDCDPDGPSECDNTAPAVIEFGAGRGYLTQILTDCYGINTVVMVERKAYKLKADRSLRQKGGLSFERLRIDIEDLDLNAVDFLQGRPYLAIGKHLCGPATDLTLRCCLGRQIQDSIVHFKASPYLRGLAIATCCHHLCQWKHYINRRYLSNLGISKEDFHAITWFTSWAVDGDHGSDFPEVIDLRLMQSLAVQEKQNLQDSGDIAEIIKSMKAVERAALGFMCKAIIDKGRQIWIRENGLDATLVKYVPSSISPENHLLLARGNHNGIKFQMDDS